MAKTSSLEAQLTALTQEFVGRIVGILRGASFDDVARFASATPAAKPRAPGRPAGRSASTSSASSATASSAAPAAEPKARGPRTRQTADRRAELADQIVSALRSANGPLGVRALASELGVAPDLLAVPLKELRTEGRVTKHGEKRSTTYSVG